MSSRCKETAKVQLPWGGQILNYCPVHANQIAQISVAIGSPIKANLLTGLLPVQCECIGNELTEEEKEMNRKFSPDIRV